LGDANVTDFEYLAIAYSLLFSASALRLIGGLPHVFSRERRYGVHAAAVVIILSATVQNFWVLLSYRNVEWTFLRFIGLLAVPGTVYFIASTIIPDDPGLIESWEKHYFEKRIQLFSGFAVWGVLSILVTTFVLGLPLAAPARGVQLGMIVMGVCGIISARPMVHKFIIGLAVILLLAFGFIVRNLYVAAG
jgi:hypothetical protein